MKSQVSLSARLRDMDEAACRGIVRAFDAPLPRIGVIILCLLCAVCGGALSVLLGGRGLYSFAACMLMMLLWSLMLLWNTRPTFLGAAAPALLLLLLFGLRTNVLHVVSPDCRDYLLVWADVMEGLSFTEIMARRVGDYTVIYQYFVYILSRLPFNRVFMYKALALVFEALLAWGAAQLVCIARREDKGSLTFKAVFLLVLALPTVLLNASVWAQCDAVYTALLLAGLAFCLRDRPCLGSVCLTIALCVKLQAIFVLPVVALLLLWRRLSLRHVLLMGGVFIAAALPAMLGGKGLKDILGIYLYQMGEYRDLSLGAPNIFAIIKNTDLVGADAAAHMGILSAFAACGAILYLGAQYRRADAEQVIAVSFALALCIPFLLPYMHERYFFAADVLSIVYAATHKKRWFVPFVVIGASLNGYLDYLMNFTLRRGA